jgi:hypothetical protein
MNPLLLIYSVYSFSLLFPFYIPVTYLLGPSPSFIFDYTILSLYLLNPGFFDWSPVYALWVSRACLEQSESLVYFVILNYLEKIIKTFIT